MLYKSHTKRPIDTKFSGFVGKHNLVTTVTKPKAERAIHDGGGGHTKFALTAITVANIERFR
jgi:hypothetical protein